MDSDRMLREIRQMAEGDLVHNVQVIVADRVYLADYYALNVIQPAKEIQLRNLTYPALFWSSVDVPLLQLVGSYGADLYLNPSRTNTP